MFNLNFGASFCFGASLRNFISCLSDWRDGSWSSSPQMKLVESVSDELLTPPGLSPPRRRQTPGAAAVAANERDPLQSSKGGVKVTYRCRCPCRCPCRCCSSVSGPPASSLSSSWSRIELQLRDKNSPESHQLITLLPLLTRFKIKHRPADAGIQVATTIDYQNYFG